MAKHGFKITVEHLSDPKGNPSAAPALCFTTENHDNILELASRLGYTDGRQLSFLVGLKLFSEVMLEDRDNPLYTEFRPHFGAFMKKLKSARKGE